jgi:hypothetical protein
LHFIAIQDLTLGSKQAATRVFINHFGLMDIKKGLSGAPHTILTPKKGRFLKIKAIISKCS